MLITFNSLPISNEIIRKYLTAVLLFSILQQKIVIKIKSRCKKCRSKAMTIAAMASGDYIHRSKSFSFLLSVFIYMYNIRRCALGETRRGRERSSGGDRRRGGCRGDDSLTQEESWPCKPWTCSWIEWLLNHVVLLLQENKASFIYLSVHLLNSINREN